MMTLMERKRQHSMKSLVKRFTFLALIVLGTAGVWAQTNNTIDLSMVTSDDITVNNGYTLTGTLGANAKITIANGAVITLDDVSINADGEYSGNHAGIYCSGDATIILSGTNTVKGFSDSYPGIGVYWNGTLTILGIGSLNATGGKYGAGIGGGSYSSCGNIVINGGTITATGGSVRAAGIGGGNNSYSCGNINIKGGTVIATGGSNAPGIGSGCGSSSSCGTITISNAVNRVTAIKGSGAPHSIGKSLDGSCGTVTIGGVVYWDGIDYKNGGDNPLTGIVRSPYCFPSSVLTDIPTGWSVTADGQDVTTIDGMASIPEGAEVVLTPPNPDKPRVQDLELLTPEQIPLTFEAMEAGAVVKFKMADVVTELVEYSTDGTTWITYTSETPIPLANVGDKVSFRGQNAAYRGSSGTGSNFSCTGNCYVYGNVMSLIYSTGFATNNELTAPRALSCLFWNNENIYSHTSKELVLPACTLTNRCYTSMFENCSHLTSAPALPATEMAENCYSAMFANCTSLTTTPALPATTLAVNCYGTMFKGCTNLTAAPDLPATTLFSSCYSSMFEGCTNLTAAPELPAPTLTSFCYNNMFKDCEKLNKVTCLATSGINNMQSTNQWLAGVASTGTFYKPTSVDWGTPGSSTIPEGWTEKPSETFLPLTFEAKEDNATVTFTKASTLSSLIVEYSTDGTTWATYETPITLEHVGDKVSFRGSNTHYGTSYGDHYSQFSCSGGKCYIYGNIMSLVDADHFATNTKLTQSSTFYKLFKNNDKIYNHDTRPLVLPATTLSSECYRGMFSGCSSLSTAPELPATTLTFCCYEDMFSGCSSLSTAPELSAETLDNFCYESMFENCTTLTTAPALPATTLAYGCYEYMFKGCTGLTTAPELPATTLSQRCYFNMFNGCTLLTTAPVLPATTLTDYCYYFMFYNCSHLNNVTCLATDISANDCTTYWLSNVAATGTFNKAASMTSWPTGPYSYDVNGIPANWTVVSILDLSTVTANTTVPNGCVVTGTLNGNYKISIADGATVTLSGVTINGVNHWDYEWAGLNCLGDATIILADGTTNTVKGFYEYYPGIHIPESSTLTIQGELAGTGTLNASSNGHGAGIGGGYNISCGNITISGGTVAATGGMDAAGIGSGSGSSTNPSSCGAITINGGTVEATGGMNAAGIGSGYRYSSCGAITISGGMVEARGDNDGAGIGSGYGSSCSTITINGGTVEATGGSNAVGIGSGGNSSSCGAITISGGTVEAKGSNAGAGIGSGYSSSCGDITIQNTVTRVTATKGNDSPNNIGAGYNSTCGTVTIGGVTGPISTSPYTYIPGALSGTFTINGSGDQVYFSQGNLRYTSGAWSFFDNQWDYYATYSADSWDKFGWSTSATTYGMSTSENNPDYSGDFVDWDATIGSGWRTLTSNEWTYMFNTRTVNGGTGDGKSYTLGQSVNGKLGIVIYPDNYTGSVYSGSDWASFEAAGCVFLPAAGSRNGASIVNAGSYGYYWSSSPNASDVNYAYRVNFYSNILSPAENGNRYRGYSVRLVRDAN